MLSVEGKSEIELEQKRKEELEKIDPIELVKEYMNDGIDKKEAIKKIVREKVRILSNI